MDRNGPATSAEIHDMLIDEWGTINVRTEGGMVKWIPRFYSVPDWDVVTNFFEGVGKRLDRKYGLEVTGLAERALRELQITYREG